MSIETLSLKCSCGYIKHDVIHLGIWQDKESKLLKYCGGLFLVNRAGDCVSCKKCGTNVPTIEFHCAFCGKVTLIPVKYREAGQTGNAVILQMSVHKTVVFSVKINHNESGSVYTSDLSMRSRLG